MRTLRLWLSERLKKPSSEILNVVRGPACLRIPVAAGLLLELKAPQVTPAEIIGAQKVCLLWRPDDNFRECAIDQLRCNHHY